MSLREIAQAFAQTLKAFFDAIIDYPIPWEPILTVVGALVLIRVYFSVFKWLFQGIADGARDVKGWFQTRKAIWDSKNAKRP
jgi:hypothetical protein